MAEIRPQSGFQTNFAQTSADIAIGGGGAGVGKTWSLLAEPLRHKKKPNFGAVAFRRTMPQIMNEGGMWDASAIYNSFGGIQKEQQKSWVFKSGAKVSFRQLQYEKTKYDWQGSEIPLILWDELTHFTKSQFLYLLSRNRSTCGIRPYMRATCNPDADSFVRDMIDWYVDPETGFIIPERSGVVRYFTIYKDEYIWGDTREEAYEKSPHLNDISEIKSFTFIEGDIRENKVLMEKDPGYMANLQAQTEKERMRLLERNWNVKQDDENLFSYIKFKDIFTNTHAKKGVKCITADVAYQGSDLLSVWVWEGNIVIDLVLIDKSTGKEIIDLLNKLKRKYGISNSNILFERDGVGEGLTGWIENCLEFKSGGRAGKSRVYKNAKSEIIFEMASSINTGQNAYYIPPDVAEKIYPFDNPKIYKGKTIRFILEHQMRAMREAKPDMDMKKSVIQKKEMKAILGDISPDVFESFAMKKAIEQRNNTNSGFGIA